MINEGDISEILSDAEAIKVLIDDMSDDLPINEQYRLMAIYRLAEDQIRRIGE